MQRTYIWLKKVASPHHQRFLRWAHTLVSGTGSARGVLLCQPQRYSMQRSRVPVPIAHALMHLPMWRTKASGNKASSVVHVLLHLAAGGGVLNVVGCSSTCSGVCIIQRLPVARIGFSAVWKLHCIASGTFCRFTSRMQNAKQTKFGISHASSGGI